MADKVRPFRLKHGAEGATTFKTLAAAYDAIRRLPERGWFWRIEVKKTRYGKAELLREGVQ